MSEATAVLLNQNGLGKIVNDGQPGFGTHISTHVHICSEWLWCCLAYTLVVTTRAEHAAYFLETTRHPERCERGKPLSINDIAVHRAEMGNVFDVKNWKPVTKTKR